MATNAATELYSKLHTLKPNYYTDLNEMKKFISLLKKASIVDQDKDETFLDYLSDGRDLLNQTISISPT